MKLDTAINLVAINLDDMLLINEERRLDKNFYRKTMTLPPSSITCIKDFQDNSFPWNFSRDSFNSEAILFQSTVPMGLIKDLHSDFESCSQVFLSNGCFAFRR